MRALWHLATNSLAGRRGRTALLVLAEGSVDRIEEICQPMVDRWTAEGISSRVLLLGPDDLGGAVHDI